MAADVTPAGAVCLALYYLELLIANLSWFQTWTGQASEALALARIKEGWILASEYATRPFIHVLDSASNSMGSTPVGTGPTFTNGGELTVSVFGVTSAAYNNDAKNANREMLNAAGQFVEAINGAKDAAIGTTGKRMAVKAWIASPPRPEDVPENADNTKRFNTWQAEIRVAWGDRVQ
jgi:hypothetical protein